MSDATQEVWTGRRLLLLTPMRLEAAAARRGAPDADVLVTGIGPRRSMRAALPASDAAAAVCGIAGALSPDLAAGEVVVATELQGAGEPFALPGAPLVAAALRRAGLAVRLGPVLSADHLVGANERAVLAAGGALAVDMESAWLTPRAAGPRGDSPAAVVRVVLDTAAAGLWSPSNVPAAMRAFRVLKRAAGALRTWAAATVPPGKEREVLLGAPRSFCAGVERAIEIVERALDRFGAPVYVRRHIVHNTRVVERLAARGAVFVRELSEVPPGAKVVLAAHGVSPGVRAEAAALGLHVVDATCPLVAKVHSEARRFARKGFDIVLIGHGDHEEVQGTVGEAPERIHVLEDASGIAGLKVRDPSRVAFLTQTTLATDEVAGVVEALRERFPELEGPAGDDICYATQNRQDAVRALAARCDTVIVVGSASSSNANRLVEVARRQGCPAHLADGAGFVEPQWLAARVGVVAAASTPEDAVSELVAAIAATGPTRVAELPVATETVQFSLPSEVR